MKSSWITKHYPSSSLEVIGQSDSVTYLKKFIESFSYKNKRKGIILYGPPGVGKTSCVYAIAKELNLEVFELNASDFRNQNIISSLVGSSSKQKSLFSKGKIILIDEVDGISGTKDRGAVVSIIKCMEASFFPVVFTANDPFHKKFSSLRKKCDLLEFNPLSSDSIFKILKDVSVKENVEVSDDVLSSFVRRCNGDARGALNDFQVLSSSNNKLSSDDLDLISDRDYKVKIEEALLRIFKTTDFKVSFDALNNTESLDDVSLWVEENLPYEYSKSSLTSGFDYLSKADVFKGRIRRWQYWRFLVYIRYFLSCGISLSKDAKNPEVVKYKRPSRLLKIYMSRMKNRKKLSIAEKLSSKMHCSIKEAFKLVPFIAICVNKNKELGLNLNLSEEEIDWLCVNSLKK